MKKIVVIIMVIVLLSVVTVQFLEKEKGIDSAEKNTTYFEESEETDISNNVDYAYVTLDLKVDYKDDSAKFKDPSVVVVSGHVAETSDFLSCGFVFTDCEVSINKIYKGNNINRTIHVIELGGHLNEKEAISFANKEGYDNYPDGLTVNYAGYTVSKSGDEVILFLTKCTDKIVTDVLGNRDDLYYIAGAVQGKLTLKNNVYESSLKNSDGTRTIYTLESFETFAEKHK